MIQQIRPFVSFDAPKRYQRPQRPLKATERKLSSKTESLSFRVSDFIKMATLHGYMRKNVSNLIQLALKEAIEDVAVGNFDGFYTEGISDVNYPTHPSDLSELIQAQVAEIIALGREQGMKNDEIISVIVGATLEGSSEDTTEDEEL